MSKKEIYNTIYIECNHKHAGRTPIKTLYNSLQSNDWYYDMELDENSHVKMLFFAAKRLLNILSHYLTVQIMDYTYKINRHRMPLFHIVGVTCTNLTELDGI